jgi:hypothetical protein
MGNIRIPLGIQKVRMLKDQRGGKETNCGDHMLDVTEESCIIEKRERESTDKIGILGGR